MLRVVLIALLAGFVGAGLQMLVFANFGLSGLGKSGQDTSSHSDADGEPSSFVKDDSTLSEDSQSAADRAYQNQELTGQLRQQQIAQLELQRKMDEVADSITALQQKLEALEASTDTALSADLSGLEESAALPSDTDTLTQDDARATVAEAPARQRRLQQFEAAGVDAGSAEQLLTRLDQQQLAELELRDEAARGGWLGSQQYEERQQELEVSALDLQRELGDAGYDRYLFASGRANRVRVDSVINGSAAQQADVRQGDLIIGYAGEQIFRINDLQAATRDGVRGEFVGLVLQRGQETISQSVERGPLGVSLSRDRQDPEESPQP